MQIKGEIKIEEVANGSEEDEYLYSATVVGTGAQEVGSDELWTPAGYLAGCFLALTRSITSHRRNVKRSLRACDHR